jgi:small GTP-binding protein
MHEEERPPIKLVILGDAFVGKTSLINMIFDMGDSNRPMRQTAGIKFHQHTGRFGKMEVPLTIWDTAGQESYRSVVPMSLRNAEIVLLTFSLIDRNSFDNLPEWNDLLKEHAAHIHSVILIGNKSDLCGQMESIPDADALEMQHRLECCDYVQTSALSGSGIDVLGDIIVRAASNPSMLRQHDGIPLKPKLVYSPALCC